MVAPVGDGAATALHRSAQERPRPACGGVTGRSRTCRTASNTKGPDGLCTRPLAPSPGSLRGMSLGHTSISTSGEAVLNGDLKVPVRGQETFHARGCRLPRPRREGPRLPCPAARPDRWSKNCPQARSRRGFTSVTRRFIDSLSCPPGGRPSAGSRSRGTAPVSRRRPPASRRLVLPGSGRRGPLERRLEDTLGLGRSSRMKTVPSPSSARSSPGRALTSAART